jgi:hypothetical protein
MAEPADLARCTCGQSRIPGLQRRKLWLKKAAGGSPLLDPVALEVPRSEEPREGEHLMRATEFRAAEDSLEVLCGLHE